MQMHSAVHTNHRRIQSNCCKPTSVRDCIASGCQCKLPSVPYLHSSRLDVRTKFYTGLQAHLLNIIMRSVINLKEQWKWRHNYLDDKKFAN